MCLKTFPTYKHCCNPSSPPPLNHPTQMLVTWLRWLMLRLGCQFPTLCRGACGVQSLRYAVLTNILYAALPVPSAGMGQRHVTPQATFDLFTADLKSKFHHPQEGEGMASLLQGQSSPSVGVLIKSCILLTWSHPTGEDL